MFLSISTRVADQREQGQPGKPVNDESITGDSWCPIHPRSLDTVEKNQGGLHSLGRRWLQVRGFPPERTMNKRPSTASAGAGIHGCCSDVLRADLGESSNATHACGGRRAIALRRRELAGRSRGRKNGELWSPPSHDASVGLFCRMRRYAWESRTARFSSNGRRR
jgi:hypothetical protein